VNVDRAAFAVSFALRLREAGVVVGLTGIESFIRGLAAFPPDSAASVYWVARVTLVQRPEDLEVFESVFAAVFMQAGGSIALNPRQHPVASSEEDAYTSLPSHSGVEEAGQGLPWTTLPAALRTAETSEETGIKVPERLASSLEGVADLPFEELDACDLALLDHWLATAMRRWPTRRSRRMTRHHAGRQVALRPTLALARHSGFEPMELVRSRQLRTPRRVVMLCDVSQSMQHQAAAYFHLMRAVTRSTDAEVFAFATTLTRLTPLLAHASADVAIEQATAKVTDRFGGTRIATNLAAFLSSSRGDTCRGAIVLVASDGWDSDPPQELAMVMARIHRRAHRVIWMNPRMSAPGFEPAVGSMAAALPYCDELLAADTIRSLAGVVAAIVR
jgi:uncharacterized protein with von Willebrand factor type A (vWA) domain